MVHAAMNTVNNLPPPFAVAPRLRRAKVCVNVLVGEVGGLSGLRCTWETNRYIESKKNWKKDNLEKIEKKSESCDPALVVIKRSRKISKDLKRSAP